MKVLVDVNLPPRWVETLRSAGHDAVHWSAIGRLNATDEAILGWAAANAHIVFTHDLDFGAILAVTRGRSPSVIQLRTEDVTPEAASAQVLDVLLRLEPDLVQGALVSVEVARARVRVLPLRQD